MFIYDVNVLTRRRPTGGSSRSRAGLRERTRRNLVLGTLTMLLSCEYGAYKTVNAGFWLQISGNKIKLFPFRSDAVCGKQLTRRRPTGGSARSRAGPPARTRQARPGSRSRARRRTKRAPAQGIRLSGNAWETGQVTPGYIRN